MNFYLAVWNSPAAILDDEAGARYSALSDEKPAEPFDGQVHAFYCRLTNFYPEVEMVPDDKLISCPWACALDVGPYRRTKQSGIRAALWPLLLRACTPWG